MDRLDIIIKDLTLTSLGHGQLLIELGAAAGVITGVGVDGGKWEAWYLIRQVPNSPAQSGSSLWRACVLNPQPLMTTDFGHLDIKNRCETSSTDPVPDKRLRVLRIVDGHTQSQLGRQLADGNTLHVHRHGLAQLAVACIPPVR
jgi:hypothetical protein